jgi:hypothetical protein
VGWTRSWDDGSQCHRIDPCRGLWSRNQTYAARVAQCTEAIYPIAECNAVCPGIIVAGCRRCRHRPPLFIMLIYAPANERMSSGLLDQIEFAIASDQLLIQPMGRTITRPEQYVISFSTYSVRFHHRRCTEFQVCLAPRESRDQRQKYGDQHLLHRGSS